jgi:hypothetical protein
MGLNFRPLKRTETFIDRSYNKSYLSFLGPFKILNIRGPTQLIKNNKKHFKAVPQGNAI